MKTMFTSQCNTCGEELMSYSHVTITHLTVHWTVYSDTVESCGMCIETVFQSMCNHLVMTGV